MTVTSRKKRNPLTMTTTKTMTDGSAVKSVYQKPLVKMKTYEAETISRKAKSKVVDLTPVEPERDEDMSEEVEARARREPSEKNTTLRTYPSAHGAVPAYVAEQKHILISA